MAGYAVKIEYASMNCFLQTAKARDGGLEAKQVTNFPPVREVLVAITNLPTGMAPFLQL